MSEHDGASGDAFADYQNPSDDFVEWTVYAPEAGNYLLQFRYALKNGDRPLEIAVNAGVVHPSLSFPETGDWSTWETVNISADLNRGHNKVQATAIGSSGANIDYLKVLAGDSQGEEARPAEFLPTFRRGDANGDGTVDLSDSLKLLAFLFLGEAEPTCLDAADSNDDTNVDLTDALVLMSHLFLGDAEVPRPGPDNCGVDPTDLLGCDDYSVCD